MDVQFNQFFIENNQSCLRSSVVERVTSNDEAVSSILAEGSSFFVPWSQWLHEFCIHLYI